MTKKNSYDYTQVSSAAGMILRRHMAAAERHGDESPSPSVLCSMAVIAPAIGTLAATMGKSPPSQAAIDKVIDDIIRLIGEWP